MLRPKVYIMLRPKVYIMLRPKVCIMADVPAECIMYIKYSWDGHVTRSAGHCKSFSRTEQTCTEFICY